MESLFSFALFVDHISVDKICNSPAVGFRFLDYPTVVIKTESKSLENSKNDNDSNNDEESMQEVHKTVFRFGKGKSCLFKNNLVTLRKLLNEVPLYVMLFDSSEEQSKLKGCCSISLVHLLKKLKEQIDDIGMDSPAVSEEVNDYIMYNLMGVKTGVLKLQLKLNFYGASLLMHKNEATKVSSVDAYLKLDNKKCKGEILDNSSNTKLEEVQAKVVTEEKGIQCIDEGYIKKKKKEKRKETFNESKRNFHNYSCEKIDDLNAEKIFCPPPLYLNLHKKTEKKDDHGSSFSSSDIHYSQLKKKLRNRYGSVDSLSSFDEPSTEILQPVDNKICIISNKQKQKEKKHCDRETVNIPSQQDPYSSSHLHSNNIDLTRLPLLSALSSEIAKLAFLMNGGTNEGITNNPNISNNSKSSKSEVKQTVADKDIQTDSIDLTKLSSPDRTKREALPKKFKEKSPVIKVTDNANKKLPKRKLKFKTTRTQKLRSKYVKESKLALKEKIAEVPEIEVESETGETHELSFNSIDEMREWLQGLSVKDTAKSDLPVLSPRDIPIPQPAVEVEPKEPLNNNLKVSTDSQKVTIDPGFYSPVQDEEPPNLGATRRLSKPKLLKRSSGSRVVESSRSVQSRGESRATAGSRNNESSLYANDTFATEDNEEEYSDSQNTLSQTSSISLPFSGRDSADVPQRQMSNLSEKSASNAPPVKHNDSKESVKSHKSLSRKESSSKSESSQHRSKTSNRSSKLKRQDNVASNESDKSDKSGKSDKSEKMNSYYTNESSKRDESKSRSQILSPSDKPDSNLCDSGEIDYFKTQKENQLKAVDSIDKNNSSHQSLYSSVGLERYMAAEDSLDTASDKNTDVDSRPATHASVNTLPEDSIISPKHASYSNHSPDKGDYVSDAPYSPDPDSNKNYEPSHTQVDTTDGVKPNVSAVSPRKSKNTSTSFQVTKRQHGMAKLDERPESQMSGDTTLREIDMMLENESLMTSGSSIMLTTDEAISPMGSMNMAYKYKQHLNQSGHNFNKFSKRQVGTLEEVEDSIDNDEYRIAGELGSTSGTLDTLPPGIMGTLPTGTLDTFSTGSMMGTFQAAGTMDTLHEHEAYEKPQKSDFSPHQSKQFVQRKTYENAFRENVPPFSSNTNESSLDSGF